MPLKQLTAQVAVSYQLDQTSTGFGTNTLKFGKTHRLAPDPAVHNAQYGAQLTIAAGGNTTLDLTALTNQANEAANFTTPGVQGILLLPTGSSVVLEPGGTNGLTWFLGGTTPSLTLDSGDVFYLGKAVATTVNSTHKTLKLSNPGGSPLTLNIILF